MAEKRMFIKKVTDDDNFMALSSSAQALYLHLSMSADDDGFSNQVSISMFKAHASVQDLQSLLEKRYIYQFDNGVIVIKHWRMANALRKDRYTPTSFQEELAKLDIKDNGSYTWLPNGCQVVAKRLPQDSIDKNRLDKNSLDNINGSLDAPLSVEKPKKSKPKDEKKTLVEGFTVDEELRELIFDFIKMRKDEMKNPMSERAVKLMLTELKKLSLDTETQKKIVEQSIKKGWNGMFPLQEDKPKQQTQQYKPKYRQGQDSVFSSNASYDISDFTSRAIGLRPQDFAEEPGETEAMPYVEQDDADDWSWVGKKSIGMED